MRSITGSKKGAEIALNTVIIAIIILVVLIIVIAFFAGGSSSVIDKVKSIFSGKTEGTDLQLAIQTCQEYCDQAKQLTQDNPSLSKASIPYCTKYFKLDANPKDGAADKVKDNLNGKEDYVRYYCSANHIATESNYDANKLSGIVNPINIGCSVDCNA